MIYLLLFNPVSNMMAIKHNDQFSRSFLVVLIVFSLVNNKVYSQDADSIMIRNIFNFELSQGECYQNLSYLCQKIGHRLSGSKGAEMSVDWTKRLMESYGFDTVYLQPVLVPRWVRGEKESAKMITGKRTVGFNILALGNSVGTGKNGITGKVVEVKSLAELNSLGENNIRGKIVFYNQPMDPSLISTFQAYGQSGWQRYRGPSHAARLGAAGVIVRSLTHRIDDYPHTGATGYEENIPQIPAIAISTLDAETLSRELKENPDLDFYFETFCRMLEDVISYNVIGELRGIEFPEEIITVGGHLDSWDVGQGAHDDGAGCLQSVEVLRILKTTGYRPKRTIRAVLFMNEENGLRGGNEYARIASEKKEKHIAALESDSGGFSPKGFGIDADEEKTNKFRNWAGLFKPYRIYEFEAGGGGADISPLKNLGVPLLGLRPDNHKYFNYHHTELDILEAVDQRELELGAAAITALIYLIDKYGL